MKAVIIKKYGSPDMLTVVDRPLPIPKSNEVRIRVMASGVNRPDVFQRKGNYPAPDGVVMDIPGLEVSGIVEQLGSDVSKWRVGDEVCALLAGGGYAQYIVVHEGHCLPKPVTLDFKEAACLPETVYTVWHNLFQRGKLHKNDRVLIHGGSGGIGTTAIQLASLYAEMVYATAGSDERCRQCEALGATQSLNYHTENFVSILKEKHISLVLDSIGGDYFRKNIELLASDGRLIYINAIKGTETMLSLSTLMHKRLTISGSTLRRRDADFKAALTMEIEANVWPLIDRGLFKPIVQRYYAYDEAAAAHWLMENKGPFGKVALVWY